MIIIRILSGPHAGKERVVEENMYEGAEINPLHLIQSLVRLGSRWDIDYSQASTDEVYEWGRADLVCRIVRGLLEGRPVFFQEKRYQASSEKEAWQLAGDVEDAIVESGHYFTIEYDDARGVSIVLGQREHPLQ